jgi:hypothetical protein
LARKSASTSAAAPEEPEPAETELDDDEEHDPAAGLPLEGIDPRFKDFVDRVARAHRPMASYLDQARLVATKDGAIEVFFPRERDANALKGAVDAPAIRDALEKAYGTSTRLIIVQPPPDASTAAPSIADAREKAIQEAQRALEAHAKSHPVVERAVALFGGEVRAVKRR